MSRKRNRSIFKLSYNRGKKTWNRVLFSKNFVLHRHHSHQQKHFIDIRTHISISKNRVKTFSICTVRCDCYSFLNKRHSTQFWDCQFFYWKTKVIKLCVQKINRQLLGVENKILDRVSDLFFLCQFRFHNLFQEEHHLMNLWNM